MKENEMKKGATTKRAMEIDNLPLTLSFFLSFYVKSPFLAVNQRVGAE